jgi:hypothetical protein
MTDLLVMSMGGSHDTPWQTGLKCWCIRWPLTLASGVDRPNGENFEQTLVRFAGLTRALDVIRRPPYCRTLETCLTALAPNRCRDRAASRCRLTRVSGSQHTRFFFAERAKRCEAPECGTAIDATGNKLGGRSRELEQGCWWPDFSASYSSPESNKSATGRERSERLVAGVVVFRRATA